MIFAKRLKGRAIAAFLGPAGTAVQKLAHEARRRIAREPDRLDFYFDLADPWSYLTAQAVERLLAVYPVDFRFVFVSPPASDVDAEPLMRTKYAQRDAHELAAYWNVTFPGKKEAEPGWLRKAGSALIVKRPDREQLRCALEVSGALWSGDAKELNLLLGKWGSEAIIGLPTVIASNYGELRDRGHYQGAMIAYHGQWYWGIDRLRYLEAELASDTGTSPAGVIEARAVADRAPLRLSPAAGPVTVDMWFSFRSPYSYLAMEQIEDVLRPFDVSLKLRPITPMVNRGHKLIGAKRMYIVRDAKREADRLGIPFGNLADPLGPAIDNCIALTQWALGRGTDAALGFCRSAMRGIWTEARDLSEYVDLRHIVERAALPWEEARAALAPEAIAAAVEIAATNATELGVIGLWGVPSFRAGDFLAWGQDRLPILADRLRRHEAAPVPPPPPDDDDVPAAPADPA